MSFYEYYDILLTMCMIISDTNVLVIVPSWNQWPVNTGREYELFSHWALIL